MAMAKRISIVKKPRRQQSKESSLLRATLGTLDEKHSEATGTSAPGAKTIEKETVRASSVEARPKKLTVKEANRRALKFLIDLAQRPESEIRDGGWELGLRQFALLLQSAERIRTDFDNEFEIDNPTALAREIHKGLNSFLNDGEWETPELRVRRWIFFGATQKKP